MIRVGFRVQEQFDILDVEAELGDAPHDQLRGGGIAGVEHDVALGSGDEEGGDVARADVVEVAGDAERFGRPLASDFRGVQPPADENQRENDQQSQHNQQASLREQPHAL